jgi:CubicO group peptidase (beta-lactamase class C family)
MDRFVTLAASAALALAAVVASVDAYASSVEPVPRAKPESVGFSSARLETLTRGMHAPVDAKQLSGVVTMITRHGKLVYTDAYGMKDLSNNAPMTLDTIFRIYSMTKPVTGVAMMILYEEGKWLPDDPISRHIPELRDLKVFVGKDAQGKPILETPAHAPTMGELMSHTAGFSYGFFGNSPVEEQYREVNPLGAPSPAEFIARLAKLPLAYQPGKKWEYSLSVDVQGYLVEKLSGTSLPDFFRERIFEPLGMKDTAFSVPAEKHSRLATIYRANASGVLEPQPHDPNITRVPGFASGGGGLWSTAGDYVRFAQMLANGGELSGVRLLAPRTVELMRANHLPPSLMSGEFGIGLQRMRPGFGFGYDVAVFEHPELAGSSVGKGTYLWDGAAGTWFWIDPTHDIVYVGMIQRMGGGPSPFPSSQSLSRPLTMQALIDPTR